MAVVEVKTYLIEIYSGDQTANARANIMLFDANKSTIGNLTFVEDGAIPVSDAGGVPSAYFPIARYVDVVDLLRNEVRCILV